MDNNQCIKILRLDYYKPAKRISPVGIVRGTDRIVVFVKSSRMCVRPATRENKYSSPQRGGRLGSLIFFPRKCQTTYMNPTTAAETKNRPRNECVNPR